MKARVVRVINASKRAGTGKTGKPYNIMEVEVEKEDGSLVHADSFDTIVDGDQVNIEFKPYTNPTTGKTYDNWSASLPKKQFGGATIVDNTEVLQAIRMCFRQIKAIEHKVDLLMGMGEPEKPAEPQKPEPSWAQAAEDELINLNAPEPTYEPLPEEPGDLEAFMNAANN
jgi:hypothetical protein